MAATDRWADWLQRRRHGDDPSWQPATLSQLEPIRERVLALAEIGPGDTVLDVGTGEGLIGFGALDRVGPTGTVIFSDISRDLLERCRELAASLGATERCSFVEASADDLGAVESSSVDVVTTRSVLIYLRDKPAALAEFFRVLRPGGRIALFEPINRFGYPEPAYKLWGYDVEPVEDVAAKVRTALEEQERNAGAGTLTDFDERDLLAWTERAGFEAIRLFYEVTINREPAFAGITWDAFLNFAGNPLAPTIAEVAEHVLTADEREQLYAHLRPLVEANEGSSRWATVYLKAEKAGV
jgi:arsenite methyltransferase